MSDGYPDYADMNSLIASNADLMALLEREDLEDLLATLHYDWGTNTFDPNSPLAPLLSEMGFVEGELSSGHLDRTGILFLSRILIHPDPATNDSAAFGNLAEKYEAFRTISDGKNSIVLEAVHRLLGTRFVLKLLRPGASTDMRDAIRVLAKLNPESAVVAPIDFIRTTVRDVLGRDVDIECLVFPMVEGPTLRDFLETRSRHLNSHVAIQFAFQVGTALAELERIGAYHGDLHDRNIIVEDRNGVLRFRIIDISFDAMGSASLALCINNDLSNFKQHIWRILSAQKAAIPGSSLRKYMGTRDWARLTMVLSSGIESFAQAMAALRDTTSYEKYLSEKEMFLSESFRSPVSFRLQRYEEITDPAMAVSLFVPLEQLMEKIRNFANIYVSGNRGSGKSTYLASLAFFPDAESRFVDYQESFGIYFPCRQGEFRPLASRHGWSPEVGRKLVTNVMITKIVRRTLEVVAAGVTARRFREASSLDVLRKIVAEFVPPPGMVSVDPSLQSELDNLVSTMVRVEMDEISELAAGREPVVERDARTLIRFLNAMRACFPDLARTRFQLLFDDAGEPYVPRNVQSIVSDLMLSSNPLYCVKLSAEKLTFRFSSSHGKPLEEGQDYFECDISQILFIGSGSGGLKRDDLETYFRRIVEQRLVYFRYAGTQIVDYLGDGISPDRLLQLLSMSAKNAYYSGWTTVWNIADRTPRNLLEIVSEIFGVAGIEPTTPPFHVAARDQDRAIRTISEKRLESLSQIPGSVTIGGEEVSLGRRLFATTSAIGSTFGMYLRAERGKERRRQHLAIERNDMSELAPEAETILRRLITFGILDANKLSYARDDNVKKPLYVLNRIYCPAFGIGYQRDDHLRLSQKRLEQLLLNPEVFIRDGTKLLRQNSEQDTPDLFRYKETRA